MLEILNTWDTKLFLLLNGMHSPFWDTVMWHIGGKFQWIPLYAFLLGYMIHRFGRRSVWIVLGAIVLITLCDQSSVHLFKNVFERLRPCHQPHLAGMVHLVKDHCGGRYGFVSSHAANTFGLAVFTGLFVRRRYYWAGMLFWALLVSYSRIYAGVHYPGDILGGAILGALLAKGMYLLMISVKRLQFKQ